jgi:hypothetical protein
MTDSNSSNTSPLGFANTTGKSDLASKQFVLALGA